MLARRRGARRADVQINGAGATFPNPIYSKWFSEYNKLQPNVRINYQPIGSGGGIRQITERTVFFGATDGPMTPRADAGRARARSCICRRCSAPSCPVYNLPGVKQELKFTGPVLADIFLGKITKWNDPAIAKLNAGVTLPGTDIVVAHRSDGSGTTYIWVDYLAKVSPELKKTVGVGDVGQLAGRRRRQGQRGRRRARQPDARRARLRRADLRAPEQDPLRLGAELWPASSSAPSIDVGDRRGGGRGGADAGRLPRLDHQRRRARTPTRSRRSPGCSSTRIRRTRRRRRSMVDFMKWALDRRPEVRHGARLRAAAEGRRRHGAEGARRRSSSS